MADHATGNQGAGSNNRSGPKCNIPHFSFIASDWTNWKKQWERYRIVSKINKEDDETQVSYLILMMGPESEAILEQFRLTEEESKEYSKVIEKFSLYFEKKENPIYDRIRFHSRVQQPNESTDAFITDLHAIAKKCNLTIACPCGKSQSLEEDFITDQIIIGVADRVLSKELQKDYVELTLQKVIERARYAEHVQKQQGLMIQAQTTGSSTEGIGGEVSRIEGRRWGKGEGMAYKRQTNTNGQRREITYKAEPNEQRKEYVKNERCFRCGEVRHSWRGCPAKEARCRRCSKKGHFARTCRNGQDQRTMAEVAEELESEESDEEWYCTSITKDKKCDNINIQDNEPWRVNITIHSKAVEFKMDTGADVTVIPPDIYKKLGLRDQELKTTKIMLRGPDKSKLEVEGKFKCELKYRNKIVKQDIFVVRKAQECLLGRGAISALGLLKRIDEIHSSGESIMEKFPMLFNGLGCMKNTYNIKIRKDASPYSVTAPRRIAIPLRKEVEEELRRMEDAGVITRITKPTEWCAPMVCVPKSKGRVRICVDYTQLNKHILKEKFVLPSTDETLALLAGGKIFTKLDASAGFWQIPLDKQTKELTTFITPEGRYYFNRVPFGITSAPEHYQGQIRCILEGLKGVVNQMDDILIFGKDREEHDHRLAKVLERLQEEGVTLNKDKCEFARKEVKFLGHIVSPEGIRSDPEKIKAILNIPIPEDVTQLRRFLGMINYLLKFLPNLAKIIGPLRELLCTKNEYIWNETHTNVFDCLKRMITNTPILAIFDPNRETRISADASANAIGAVLEQKQRDQWHPVFYISRGLTDTEKRYAQIEKEALGITWACERLSQFITGKHFTIRTDHRPLTCLLATKPLSELTPRIQRFRMRLMHFSYEIQHVAGREFYVPDTLSRAAPRTHSGGKEEAFCRQITKYIRAVQEQLPFSEDRLRRIQQAQEEDETSRNVKHYILKGWPRSSKNELPEFYKERADLVIIGGLIVRGLRIYIPGAMQKEILEKIHEGHFGLNKCLNRARSAVWWPGINDHVRNRVLFCRQCIENRVNHLEPMVKTDTPNRPWMQIGIDLLEQGGNDYLVIYDYFSRFLFVERMARTTSQAVVEKLAPIFAEHGVPDIVRTDNGPQFSGDAFKRFASEYEFTIKTSSPYYARSNGLAESGVHIAKNILRKEGGLNKGLLSYRSTPLACGYCPSELLMGRKIRSTLPMIEKHLTPGWPFLRDFRTKDRIVKDRQKTDYDKRHKTSDLSELKENDEVWIVDKRRYGVVERESGEPRSYIIGTGEGRVRRNRYHLIPTGRRKEEEGEHEENMKLEDPQREPPKMVEPGLPIQMSTPQKPALGEKSPTTEPSILGSSQKVVRTTRSGRLCKSPQRLDL